MFGMVLAIGLVVDDAIVVVEGVQRHIEEGLALRMRLESNGRALRAGHRYRPGSLAVFVPTVFIPGITGRLYQQFALTIAISVSSRLSTPSR